MSLDLDTLAAEHLAANFEADLNHGYAWPEAIARIKGLGHSMRFTRRCGDDDASHCSILEVIITPEIQDRAWKIILDAMRAENDAAAHARAISLGAHIPLDPQLIADWKA